MESALAKAYEGNPQLNAQRAIVRQNDEGVSQALVRISADPLRYCLGRQSNTPTQPALFRRFPPTGLSDGFSYTDKGYTNPWSVGLSGQQTLFNGQRNANNVRKAESQVSAARETLRMMEESVLLAAATAYMDMSRDTPTWKCSRPISASCSARSRIPATVSLPGK